jgi:hypothetical protein
MTFQIRTLRLLLCAASSILPSLADEPWPSLFDPFRVQTLYIQINPEKWDAIRQDTNFYDPELNLREPCLLWMSGDSPPNSLDTAITVEIRRKSDPALPSEADPQKVSLKIDVNEYVKGQSIRGLKKLSLENGSGNGVLKEALAMNLHRMAAEAGFTPYNAGYASWVRLVVNGDYVGLYACPEQRDKAFLENRGMYREGASWLYEINGGIFRDGTVSTADSPTHTALNYYPFRGPDNPPEPVQFETEVSTWVDMPTMLTFAAIEAFIANNDGLFTKSAANQGKNSFCVDWLPSTQHRRYYMPWDLDGGFNNTGWDIYLGGSKGRYQTMILGHYWFREMYRQIFTELLDGPLSGAALNAWLDRWEEAVGPALAEDPNADPGEIASARSFFAARIPNVRTQLGQIIQPPVFNPGAGEIADGFAFAMSHANSNGTSTIHYTTDGSDPRAFGGAVAAGALAYTGPIALPAGTQVMARVRNDTAGTIRWSNIRRAVFNTAGALASLKLTEIHYRPAAGAPFADRDEFEFIELKNTSSTSLRLDGCRLQGIDYVFPSGTVIGPGAFHLLIANPAAFSLRYPGVPYHGVFWKKLSNTGERISLRNSDGTTVFSCNYAAQSPWPLAPLLDGRSLVNHRPDGDPDDPENWRASTHIHGSPGSDDPVPPYVPGLVINEVIAKTSQPLEDAVEIHNPTASPIDISGWWLSDAFNPTNYPVDARLRRYRIPQGTVVAAGGYVVFYESQFNPPSPSADVPSPFGFSQDGEMVCLSSADAAGNLTGHIVSRRFGAAETNISHGRIATSEGWDFGPLRSHSFGVSDPVDRAQFQTGTGAANAAPLTGPVVISEIAYHPLDGGTEFIELMNHGEEVVDLGGWELGGASHVFAAGTFIQPQGLLLLANTPDTETFRTTHEVPASVPVVSGTFVLDDDGEALELRKPNIEPLRPPIVVERIRYNDKSPWPTEVNGTGFSLERIVPAAYGNEPLHWHCGTPGSSPGRFNPPHTSTLIAHGGKWRFHSYGRDLGSAWRGPAYRDNGWDAGRTPIGFGHAVATVLPYPAPPRPLVTWLRKEFSVADAHDAIVRLDAAFNYNDGFIAYLNGIEIARRSLPAEVTPETAADPHPHGTFERTDLTPVKSLLVQGRNVLAVQLHLAAPDDADAHFDAVLTYSRLTSGTAPDTDGDGMPDDWEIANGLDPHDPDDALRDADGDGYSNLEEYLAGTNPSDSSSRPGFSVIEVGASGRILSFPTVIGRRYTVQWSEGLDQWFDLLSGIDGTGGLLQVEDPEPAIHRRFYRLSIQP